MKKLLIVLSISVLFACKDKVKGGSFDGLSQDEAYEQLETERAAIKALANIDSCDGNSVLSYIAFGDKACGGPWEYLAYSDDLNVSEFRSRVEDFNELEREYNSTFEVASDCMAALEPSGVICTDGQAEFVYDF